MGDILSLNGALDAVWNLSPRERRIQCEEIGSKDFAGGGSDQTALVQILPNNHILD
jgi:hypothetical protein